MAEGRPPAAECTGEHQSPEHQTETASLCEEKTLGPEAAGPGLRPLPCTSRGILGTRLHLSKPQPRL